MTEHKRLANLLRMIPYEYLDGTSALRTSLTSCLTKEWFSLMLK